jgi:hypothetical protein
MSEIRPDIGQAYERDALDAGRIALTSDEVAAITRQG